MLGLIATLERMDGQNVLEYFGVRIVAGILGEKATVIKYPVGHFDIYKGEIFDKVVDAELDFLKRVLIE